MVRRALILVPLVLIVLAGLFFLLRPPTSTPESATSTDESTTEGAQEKTFDLAVTQGTMTPEEITVGEDDQVRFRITSDNPVAFHLHGYDLEQEVTPGETAELSFTATITGRFEIENEQTREELGVLLVQPR